jgi:hypothetical protein
MPRSIYSEITTHSFADRRASMPVDLKRQRLGQQAFGRRLRAFKWSKLLINLPAVNRILA